ncbi:hypothetical protein LCGC14_1699030 [marine sediment metagenome]|uniref:Uncharacterized protein n=1 Tax=marine sediment metagenome TaxID=412755 RepID=A0A0F9I664_9ZZZZ
MKSKYYYIIETKHTDAVNINRAMLPLGPMPVLWCNDGMFALIPSAMLEEIYGLEKDAVLRIFWCHDVYEMPQEIGMLLCDKGYNQSSDNHK